MKQIKRCPEIDPEGSKQCIRAIDHKGDHYPAIGEYCWRNASSRHVAVDFDTAELWTLWVVMRRYAPNHVRYDRINEKLTAALKEAGEEVE